MTHTITVYRHSLVRPFLYTPQVQDFAESQSSYWLLDVLATEVLPLHSKSYFLAVTLEVTPKSQALLSVTDGNETTLFVKKLDFTSTPTGIHKFFLVDNVCMLPEEY